MDGDVARARTVSITASSFGGPVDFGGRLAERLCRRIGVESELGMTGFSGADDDVTPVGRLFELVRAGSSLDGCSLRERSDRKAPDSAADVEP